MDLATKIEHSRLWLLGRIFVPKRIRRRSCEARGDHKPEIVDAGRAKICPYCGTW